MDNKWRGLPIVIFGIGGFSKEVKILIDDINRSSYIPIFDLLGFVCNSSTSVGNIVEGIPIIAYNDEFTDFSRKFNKLGVVIALGNPIAKFNIENEILNKCTNLLYPNLIHPKANITSSDSNDFGIGNIICSGVTVTTNIKLGKFIIININSTIGHDAIIEDYCTINPLSAISGNVHIKKGTLIGAGASVMERICIGEKSIVGLGAIVVKNVADGDIIICKAGMKMDKKSSYEERD